MTLSPDLVALIANYQGNKYPRRNGDLRRAHRAEITLHGVEMIVDYDEGGAFLSATATDPSELPWCEVKAVQIGGQDVTSFLVESQLMEIAERVESNWTTNQEQERG